MYIPISWFQSAAGKAELVSGSSLDIPYMQVFYTNGKFDHLRLFVYDGYDHPSWGAAPSISSDEDAKYQAEDLQIKY